MDFTPYLDEVLAAYVNKTKLPDYSKHEEPYLMLVCETELADKGFIEKVWRWKWKYVATKEGIAFYEKGGYKTLPD